DVAGHDLDAARVRLLWACAACTPHRQFLRGNASPTLNYRLWCSPRVRGVRAGAFDVGQRARLAFRCAP
ncbi:MAG TPA: hypothetical protein VFC15_04200, partial [Candidatus Limnocylindrales bacterium]|nr:hypothetical protein [Candidatus Limnocylindrales bacterium]